MVETGGAKGESLGMASVVQPFRGVVRWLLRLNLPAPQRSEAEIAAEVERNYRWNFVVNLMDGASFWFGASFISGATILPLFVSKLTTDPLPIGILAVISQAGWLFPQLLTANFVERLPRKKPMVVNVGLFLERMPVWCLVGTALLAGRWRSQTLILFFLVYAWYLFGAGIIAPAWQDFLARVIPVDRRGRFLGLTNFIGAGTGALGAGFSTWLLQTQPFPRNFVFIFLIAALAISMSWVWLALAREPVHPVAAQRQSMREFIAGLPTLLGRDHNFRRFLVARALMALGGMGLGFVTVAALQRWHVPDSTAGLYTLALLAGQTAGNLALGILADRYGHKLSLELGILADLLGFAVAWLAPAPGWYFVAFALFGIGSSVYVGAALLVVMEFGTPERRPTYIGMASTSAGLASAVAPLLGAAVAGVGYGPLFALSAAINLLALVLMRRWVREPRWESAPPVGEVLS